MPGGLFFILPHISLENFLYDFHTNETPLNFNKQKQKQKSKSYKYTGKNNFYKQHNNKKINEIKNNENKNNENNNVIKFTKALNKTQTNIYVNKGSLNICSSNNFIRCLGMKLFIKKNIINLIKKNHNDLDCKSVSLIFIKLYRVYLFIIIKLFYDNLNMNVDCISPNNIESMYLLKFKNIILENDSLIKLIDIIERQLILFIKKQFGIKTKHINNNCTDIYPIKSNDKCPITLEDLGKVYFHCTECNIKYSSDGLMFLHQTNDKCSTPWCSNNINQFDFCCKKKYLNKVSILNEINYYYNLVVSENLISGF